MVCISCRLRPEPFVRSGGLGQCPNVPSGHYLNIRHGATSRPVSPASSLISRVPQFCIDTVTNTQFRKVVYQPVSLTIEDLLGQASDPNVSGCTNAQCCKEKAKANYQFHFLNNICLSMEYQCQNWGTVNLKIRNIWWGRDPGWCDCGSVLDPGDTFHNNMHTHFPKHH